LKEWRLGKEPSPLLYAGVFVLYQLAKQIETPVFSFRVFSVEKTGEVDFEVVCNAYLE
jgi:hypothetical protein